MREPKSDAARIFGERVRSNRQRLGISQETLAQLSDVHWTFVGQVERGTRNLSLHNIIKLAAGLDIDPAVLVAGIEASAVPHEERAQSRSRSHPQPATGRGKASSVGGCRTSHSTFCLCRHRAFDGSSCSRPSSTMCISLSVGEPGCARCTAYRGSSEGRVGSRRHQLHRECRDRRAAVRDRRETGARQQYAGRNRAGLGDDRRHPGAAPGHAPDARRGRRDPHPRPRVHGVHDGSADARRRSCRRIRCARTATFFPDLAELESLVTGRTRVLVVNSPSNPLGTVFSGGRAARTARLREAPRPVDPQR